MIGFCGIRESQSRVCSVKTYIMDSLCAKCSISVKSNYIACHICKVKFHFVCARIDNAEFYQLMVDNKNIVFNCDDCLKVSSNMKSTISLLSQELRELKQTILSSLCADVNLIKQEINKISKNIEKPLSHKKADTVNMQSATVDDTIRDVSNVVGVTTVADNVMGQTGFESVSANLSSKKACGVGESSSSLPTVNVAAKPMIVASTSKVASGGFSGVVKRAGLVLPECEEFSDAVSETALGGSSAVNTAEWTNVTLRKQKKRRVVFGSNVNTELDVIVKKKWVHLSSFKSTVTEDCIVSYVSKHLNIDKDNLVCYKLIKKDTSVDGLKFINFKLGINPIFYAELFKPDLWTAAIKIRPFKVFPRKLPQLEET